MFLFSSSSWLDRTTSKKNQGRDKSWLISKFTSMFFMGFWKEMEREKFGANENQLTFPIHTKFQDILMGYQMWYQSFNNHWGVEGQFETLQAIILTSVSYKKHGNNTKGKSEEYICCSNIVAEDKCSLGKSLVWFELVHILWYKSIVINIAFQNKSNNISAWETFCSVNSRLGT